MSEHALYVMPAPGTPDQVGELTPEDAAEWLRERATGYAQIVGDCNRSETDGVRSAAEWLLMDLAAMCEACGEALDNRRSATVRTVTMEEDEYESCLPDAAAILLSGESAHSESWEKERAMADLTSELARKLRAAEGPEQPAAAAAR